VEENKRLRIEKEAETAILWKTRSHLNQVLAGKEQEQWRWRQQQQQLHQRYQAQIQGIQREAQYAYADGVKEGIELAKSAAVAPAFQPGPAPTFVPGAQGSGSGRRTRRAGRQVKQQQQQGGKAANP